MDKKYSEKILVVGQHDFGSTSWSRLTALRQIFLM